MTTNKQNNMSKHIDKNVMFFFITVFLVSASALAYRFYKQIPCKEVIFSINAKEFRQGELVKFIDETEGAKIWNWKFGDSTEAETLKDPIHIFTKPGEYKIRLIVNDLCEKIETITIKEKIELLDPDKKPKFSLPKSIMVGQVLRVKDSTFNASTWEWRFGENARVDAKTRYAKYEYKTPGLKTVSLIVNGDLKHIAKKRIRVLPIEKEEISKIPIIKEKPMPVVWNIKKNPKKVEELKIKKSPKKVIVPFINEAEFKKKLLLVAKGRMKPNQFSEYMCGNINQSIVVDGKNTTFLVFCQKINGKKIRIKSLTLYRDKGSNCIKTVSLKYRNLGIW